MSLERLLSILLELVLGHVRHNLRRQNDNARSHTQSNGPAYHLARSIMRQQQLITVVKMID